MGVRHAYRKNAHQGPGYVREKRMRVLMLSWEYPPKIVGGIARHVYDLSQALAANGVEVEVVTCEHPDAPADEKDGNLRVHRVAAAPGDDFVHSIHNLNVSIEKRVDELLEGELRGTECNSIPNNTELRGTECNSIPNNTELRGTECNSIPNSYSGSVPDNTRGLGMELHSVPRNSPTVLHAHDWLTQFCGKNLKHKHHIPLVSTIHATEHGRNSGIHTDLQRYIHDIERELAFESWRVICCSDYMKEEIAGVLEVPPDKIDVIPNGINPEKFDIEFDKAEFRSYFAKPEEKIIFFVGRMVHEKGVQVLIEALPIIREAYNDCKLVIVGGGNKDHLIRRVNELGLNDRVYFTGYIDDETLVKLYSVIDVAVYPSLYEPFGIVALEAMAARVPVVVTDVGGLREVVDHGVAGLTAWSDNPDSLAWGISQMLKNPYTAKMMVENAYRKVTDVFNWTHIAEQTAEVYGRVWSEFEQSDWKG